METNLKTTVRVLLSAVIAPVALALLVTAAAAQYYSPDIVARCTRAAAKMPGTTCMTCDNFRDYYEHACEANGGTMPGATATYDNRSDDSSAPRHRNFNN
jgi:hypothetical protein